MSDGRIIASLLICLIVQPLCVTDEMNGFGPFGQEQRETGFWDV
jgi:hypothetical protein